MSIEGGSVGGVGISGGVGIASSGIGLGSGSGIGSIGGGIEVGSGGIGLATGIGVEEAASVSEPTSNFGASAFEAASSISVLSVFGRAMEFSDIGSFINEEPVGADFNLRKDTMPYIIGEPNLIEQVFEPKAPLVIREAENIVARLWDPIEAIDTSVFTEQAVLDEANHWLGIGIDQANEIVPIVSLIPDQLQNQIQNDQRVGILRVPQSEPRIAPIAIPYVLEYPYPQTEDDTSPTKNTPYLPPQLVLKEEQIEKIIEEKEIQQVEKLAPQQAEIPEEEIENSQKIHVVDEGALSQVIIEFSEAVIKAKQEAEKLGIKITGELIDDFIPGQHPGNESGVVKGKGSDGSIAFRKELIKNLGIFSSAEQAKKQIVKIAYEKPPIALKTEGQLVGDEAIQVVYKDYVTKPQAVIVFETRIVKKRKMLIEQGLKLVEASVIVPSNEGTIEDLDLAKVFKKAA